MLSAFPGGPFDGSVGADHSPPGRRRGVETGESCWKTSTLRALNTKSDNRLHYRRAVHRLRVGRRCWPSTHTHQKSCSRQTRGGGWRRLPAALPAVQPATDTYLSAGRLSESLDAETTQMLLGEVPAAFHAGIHEILLIAFGLAWTEFLGFQSVHGTPIGIGVEGHGRHEELSPEVDLTRTVGWFTTKYPVSLAVGGLSWTQVVAGDAALGAVIKDAKEQLRALPDGLTYGVLRYLNSDLELGGSDPAIGFNYLGRLGGAGVEPFADLWRISQDGMPLIGASTALPIPLSHTVELNAVTVDTDSVTPAERRLDVGALSVGRSGGQPIEPVVVRRTDRHVRPRAVAVGAG